jgi:hypothetical protein
MNRSPQNVRSSNLQSQLRRIQATWSPSERSRRAEQGSRRAVRLLGQIAPDGTQPEIWAVGSFGVRRLTG